MGQKGYLPFTQLRGEGGSQTGAGGIPVLPWGVSSVWMNRGGGGEGGVFPFAMRGCLPFDWGGEGNSQAPPRGISRTHPGVPPDCRHRGGGGYPNGIWVFPFTHRGYLPIHVDAFIYDTHIPHMYTYMHMQIHTLCICNYMTLHTPSIIERKV